MERSTCRRNTPPVVRISAAPPYFFVVRRILYSPVPGQMCVRRQTAARIYCVIQCVGENDAEIHILQRAGIGDLQSAVERNAEAFRTGGLFGKENITCGAVRLERGGNFCGSGIQCGKVSGG